jgi:protein-S-isoprenylcysteine O-methyltransferase Ste14
MTRRSSLIGSFAFLVLAPGVVAVLVPWWISRWHIHPPLLGLGATRALGPVLLVAGAVGLLDSFARFALRGRGTPAPILPTERLVVSGLYRYVRNPMYLAVTSIVLGQALLFGEVRLIGYGALVWLAFHLFVIGYEEPTLRRAFGAGYERYRASVPRWIPRLRPWRSEHEMPR